ncbi:MAG TPA: M1 family aminopeptidase [Nitrospira sp.]|nr:M1 family aminopeptidase [Nitrospira sp.]
MPEQGATIRHHELFAQLDPPTHALTGRDRLTIAGAHLGQPVRFSLASALSVDRITVSSSDAFAGDASPDIPFEIERQSGSPQTQRIAIPASAVVAKQMTITVFYHGLIDDPPKEPRHLRFITPSETAGHIGSAGVYLSGESGWYPDVPDSLSTYHVRVALPEGWTAVTQAKPQSTIACPPEYCRDPGWMLTEWPTTLPAEALTLAANRFVSKTRNWQAKNGQSIEVATHLLPGNADLADEYLDAAIRYLDAYIPLLGPYPFERFAVAENFFASGLGMPSFTLLGGGVIKRHYVQPYALGHEIVHSWIGNAVFNRTDRGNWVEGLTTYLANYYWYELIGDPSQALEQRRLFLRGYNLHVPPERDYPLGQFVQKRDERDNAIGYQKAAMVFHLLRQEVGEEAFWSGLKHLVARYVGRHAEWTDIERVFSDTSGKDLRWFFTQWVEHGGAPFFSIADALGHPGTQKGSFQLDVGIAQTGGPFRAIVGVAVGTEDGRGHIIPFQVSEALETLSIQLPLRPLTVTLDPEAMLMRRIPRASLPPVLNHYVTDTHRTVLAAFVDPPGSAHPFRDLLGRIRAQDERRPDHERTVIADDLLFPKEGSVLVLGGPEFQASLRPMLATHCGDRVTLNGQRVVIDDKAYEGAGTALLISCHRVDRPGSVLSLLYAETPDAAAAVARLLFFYGWNSYVTFQNGAVVTRGEWPVLGDRADRMEVRIDERDAVR